jgi:mono/diheme cytochrome c family protein
MNRKSLVTAGALVLVVSTTCWAAQDGASLYKKKCTHCHGAKGEGKAAVKAPALKGTTLEVSQLAEQITKGKAGAKAPHNKGIAGLNDEQAKAIAEYIKALQ